MRKMRQRNVATSLKSQVRFLSSHCSQMFSPLHSLTVGSSCLSELNPVIFTILELNIEKNVKYISDHAFY